MTLAAIMVTVDFDPASKARISLAADLARRFGSLLIGVAGWPLLKRPGERRQTMTLRNGPQRNSGVSEKRSVKSQRRSPCESSGAPQ
jgi:hypothetical protein